MPNAYYLLTLYNYRLVENNIRFQYDVFKYTQLTKLVFGRKRYIIRLSERTYILARGKPAIK